MIKKELENLGKDELFEKIKAEYARKAKYQIVTGIVFGLLWLAITFFTVYYVYFKADSSPFVLLSVILLVITLEKGLSSLMAKNIMKAKNAEELLSRHDAYTNKIGKCLPFIAVPALFLIGYLIFHMITQTNIERFGVVLFWLIIAFLVLCFIILLMMVIPMKGNAKGVCWKDDAFERLRELVDNEQQDT